MDEKKQTLREKGIELKNDAATRLLPNAVNHTILIASTLVVILATLSNPESQNICLYRTILCTLLLSILSGVLCTVILTIDFYVLGRKVLKEADKPDIEDEQPKYIRTGLFPLISIISSFSLCLLSFLISVILLVFYAW